MRDLSICSPHIYYDKAMQEFIRRRCKDEDKQWIYNMIDRSEPCNDNEIVYLEEDEWLLCKDIHQGTDFRMLILFRDRSLRTLRDLRAEHVPLLRDVDRKVREWLNKTVSVVHVPKYEIYFHYMPSVYQLHAHVCMPGAYYNSMRSHGLQHVVRNLAQDSLWYHNALIMFSVNKTIRQMHLYRVLNADTFLAVQHVAPGESKVGARAAAKPWARLEDMQCTDNCAWTDQDIVGVVEMQVKPHERRNTTI
jgi:hypothetical protein